MFPLIVDVRPLVARLAGLLRHLHQVATNRYRPELHYMRGPGPRWNAKHIGSVARAGIG